MYEFLPFFTFLMGRRVNIITVLKCTKALHDKLMLKFLCKTLWHIHKTSLTCTYGHTVHTTLYFGTAKQNKSSHIYHESIRCLQFEILKSYSQFVSFQKVKSNCTGFKCFLRVFQLWNQSRFTLPPNVLPLSCLPSPMKFSLFFKITSPGISEAPAVFNLKSVIQFSSCFYLIVYQYKSLVPLPFKPFISLVFTCPNAPASQRVAMMSIEAMRRRGLVSNTIVDYLLYCDVKALNSLSQQFSTHVLPNPVPFLAHDTNDRAQAPVDSQSFIRFTSRLEREMFALMPL